MGIFNNLKGLTVGLGLVGSMATAMANSEIVIQKEIRGIGGRSLSLPGDGSNCDPSIIGKNLKILNQSNLLEDTNLTETPAAMGHCYGACQSDLEDALAEHCKKAEKTSRNSGAIVVNENFFEK